MRSEQKRCLPNFTELESAAVLGMLRFGCQPRMTTHSSSSVLSLLVVDDDDALRTLLGRIFEDHGQVAVESVEAELRRTAEDGDLVLAVTDAQTRILWTYGGRVMRRKAETVNFVPGGRWDDQSVGTNALDLAQRTAEPAMVFSAEHYASIVHNWVCWAGLKEWLKAPLTKTSVSVPLRTRRTASSPAVPLIPLAMTDQLTVAF